MATPATALWLLKLGSQLAKYPEKARKYLFKGPGKGKPHRTDIEFEKDTVSTPGSGLRTKYKVKRGPVRYSDPDLSEGGLFVRNPFLATVGTTGAAGGGYLAYKGLLEPEAEGQDTPAAPSPDVDPDMKQLVENHPSMSPGHRSAYLNKRRSRIKKGMKRLLNQYMIIAAVNPDGAEDFLKSGMKMMEMDQEFNDDIYMQDAYDSVFQEGNMPTSGRDAFERLVPYVGYKDASDVSGVYKDLVPDYKPHLYSTKGEFKLQKILALPREKAIQAIIGAWISKQFELPDRLESIDRNTDGGRQAWYDEAAGSLDLIKSGGTGGAGAATGQILGSKESP